MPVSPAPTNGRGPSAGQAKEEKQKTIKNGQIPLFMALELCESNESNYKNCYKFLEKPKSLPYKSSFLGKILSIELSDIVVRC